MENDYVKCINNSSISKFSTGSTWIVWPILLYLQRYLTLHFLLSQVLQIKEGIYLRFQKLKRKKLPKLVKIIPKAPTQLNTRNGNLRSSFPWKRFHSILGNLFLCKIIVQKVMEWKLNMNQTYQIYYKRPWHTDQRCKCSRNS